MSRQKGFIKILESIIAAIILLTALTFFFSMPLKQTGWDDALLQIRAEDALYAAAESGIIQSAVTRNDPGAINTSLTSSPLGIFSLTTDYSLTIDGIPNPIIYVGCMETDGTPCSTSHLQALQSDLAPLDFMYKNRSISIRVENTSISSIRDQTNILFSFGYVNYTTFQNNADSFLKRGGTLFILGDINQGQANDPYIRDRFGLNWSSGTAPSSGNFYLPNDESKITFRIAKYYMNVSGGSTGDGFSFSTTSQISTDSDTVVSQGALSLVKVNEGVIYGNGRTAWMAQFDAGAPQMKNLTKAIVMWASGERFSLDVSTKSPLTRNTKSSVLIYGDDPYKVTITVWRVFQ